MSVFLRWGIFGILGVAALVYAYNASKSMAEKRAARDAAAVSVPAPAETPDAEPAREPEPAAYRTPPHCEAELVVAQRALEARRQGEALDRLLRIQEIAWQEPPVRRQRLEKVATTWYQLEGEEPVPEALRIAVISDCVRFSPAP
jgi:thioredoxin-like negative regulator of GroEL